MPVCDFVQQQVFCFLAVVHRVVHLFACQFVVFHQPVVRAFGEQQGGDVERIDQLPVARPVRKQVTGIVVDDIMSADVVHPLQKVKQLFFRCFMESRAIIAECPDVVYFVVCQADLDVNDGISRHVVRRIAGGLVRISAIPYFYEFVPYRHASP